MSPKTDPAVSREIADRFGANLIRLRRRARLSQEEVGVRASLHRTEIGKLEKGLRLPRIDTLIKLADSLECAPDELLEGIAWRPVAPRQGDFSVASCLD